MSPKLKLWGPSAQSPPSEPPRNSFTMTDYYRTTREEYFSPISRTESLSPDSPYADLLQGSPTTPPRLARIHEGKEPETVHEPEVAGDGDADGTGALCIPRRPAIFSHVFDALFRKRSRHKEGNVNDHKAPPTQ